MFAYGICLGFLFHTLTDQKCIVWAPGVRGKMPLATGGVSLIKHVVGLVPALCMLNGTHPRSKIRGERRL